jgi:hypothetical protein
MKNILSICIICAICGLFSAAAGAAGIEIPADAGTRMAVIETKIGSGSNVLDLTKSSQASVTNGQLALSVTHGVMLWAAVGNTVDFTNTVTLADPGVGVAGRTVLIYNAGTTNNLAIAKSGNFVSTALDIAPGNTALITAVATNKWAGK